MSNNNPHKLKNASLFAMFCLSYFPLFFLLSFKILLSKSDLLHFAGCNKQAFTVFFVNFSFVIFLVALSLYAFLGTFLTIRNIKKIESTYNPVKIKSIKPRNEEALSYLATYVIPLVAQGELGTFEYVTFIVLFIIYYKLYSTSSLILINPILNMKYGLFEIEYVKTSDAKLNVKSAYVITEQKWLNEGDEIKIKELSHRLHFAV